MYSQLYPVDLDNWKIWEVQSESKPTEDYVTMDDDLDNKLLEGVQELAVEKPAPVADASDAQTGSSDESNDQGEWLTWGNMSWRIPSDMIVEEEDEAEVVEDVEDEAVEDVEDVTVEDVAVDMTVEGETEELPPVADATMQVETDEAQKVWANEQGGASLLNIPSSGEYFYLY